MKCRQSGLLQKLKLWQEVLSFSERGISVGYIKVDKEAGLSKNTTAASPGDWHSPLALSAFLCNLSLRARRQMPWLDEP